MNQDRKSEQKIAQKENIYIQLIFNSGVRPIPRRKDTVLNKFNICMQKIDFCP